MTFVMSKKKKSKINAVIFIFFIYQRIMKQESIK